MNRVLEDIQPKNVFRFSRIYVIFLTVQAMLRR